MTTLEVLENGRAYLVAHGWIQGKLDDFSTGGVCSAGALCAGFSGSAEAFVARLEFPESMTIPLPVIVAQDYLEKAITALYPDCGPTLTTWNDDEGRTFEEVLALFDKGIELLKADQAVARAYLAVQVYTRDDKTPAQAMELILA